MKHVLALTYEPKIPDVKSGRCNQTIRPCGQRLRRKDDLIMFHGWSDKPYRSKWNWRTPYWKILEVLPIAIGSNFVEVHPWLWDKLHDMDKEEMNDLAIRDGFKNYDEMYKQFELMYGSRLEDMIFEVIRWNYTPYNL